MGFVSYANYVVVNPEKKAIYYNMCDFSVVGPAEILAFIFVRAVAFTARCP